MSNHKVFTFIGGDKRYEECINYLDEDGYTIKAFGFNNQLTGNTKVYDKLDYDLFDCDVLILPIPYKNKNGYIQYTDHQVELKEILPLIHASTYIILGKADKEFTEYVEKYKLQYCDILDDERFAILNAIPSAEGAIQKAMEMTDITIHGADILVLGYGRLGKSLARMLKGIGANVMVEARNNKDLTWIYENGYKPIHLEELDTVLHMQNIIFNTIPHLILDKKKLEKVRRDTLIIDLASYPGGVDFEAAKELGITASLELGLPGKVAPKTAAKIVYMRIKELLKTWP